MFSGKILAALVIVLLAGGDNLKAAEETNASAPASGNPASDEAERAIKGFTLPEGF